MVFGDPMKNLFDTSPPPRGFVTHRLRITHCSRGSQGGAQNLGT